MELADASERVMADDFEYISPPIGRNLRCGFYTFRTKWSVSASQHLHMCVIPYFGRPSKPCFEEERQ